MKIQLATVTHFLGLHVPVQVCSSGVPYFALRSFSQSNVQESPTRGEQPQDLPCSAWTDERLCTV